MFRNFAVLFCLVWFFLSLSFIRGDEVVPQEMLYRGFKWGAALDHVKKVEKGKLVSESQGATSKLIEQTLAGETIIPVNDVTAMIEEADQQVLVYSDELLDVQADIEYSFWQNQLYKVEITLDDREFPNVSGYSETFLRNLLKVMKSKYGKPAREINEARRRLTFFYDLDETILRMTVYYRSENFSSRAIYEDFHRV